MKNEKHVCRAERLGHYVKGVKNNKEYLTYFWTFDKVKTKNGCYSYFENQCN